MPHRFALFSSIVVVIIIIFGCNSYTLVVILVYCVDFSFVPLLYDVVSIVLLVTHVYEEQEIIKLGALQRQANALCADLGIVVLNPASFLSSS